MSSVLSLILFVFISSQN